MVSGRKNRVTAMKNNVPKTKEKTDAEYAIAVAAQEEWNRMQGLTPAWPTSILENNLRSTNVRRLELTIYVFIVDKREQKCIPNTTYGSFLDYLKTG